MYVGKGERKETEVEDENERGGEGIGGTMGEEGMILYMSWSIEKGKL